MEELNLNRAIELDLLDLLEPVGGDLRSAVIQLTHWFTDTRVDSIANGQRRANSLKSLWFSLFFSIRLKASKDKQIIIIMNEIKDSQKGCDYSDYSYS